LEVKRNRSTGDGIKVLTDLTSVVVWESGTFNDLLVSVVLVHFFFSYFSFFFLSFLAILFVEVLP